MTKDKNRDVGKRLSQVRNKLGYKQYQFADMLSTSPASYNQYENGERTLSWEFVHELHIVFNVNLKWLYSGEGVMFSAMSADTNAPELTKEIERLRKENQELKDELIVRFRQLVDNQKK